MAVLDVEDVGGVRREVERQLQADGVRAVVGDKNVLVEPLVHEPAACEQDDWVHGARARGTDEPVEGGVPDPVTPPWSDCTGSPSTWSTRPDRNRVSRT